MYYSIKPGRPGWPDVIYSPKIKGCSWFTSGFIAQGLSKPLLHKYVSEEMRDIYAKHHSSLAGTPLPTPDCLPVKLYLNPESRRKPSGITQDYLGHFFESASGGLFVSSAFAEVLRQHDLGATQLTPTPIFDAKGTTLIEPGTDYYHLWIGEAKDTLLDMASAGALCKPSGPSSQTWMIISSLDNVLALEKKALLGLDLWIEQQACISTFFMSDRLHSVLKKAKLLGRLRFARARVLHIPTAD